MSSFGGGGGGSDSGSAGLTGFKVAVEDSRESSAVERVCTPNERLSTEVDSNPDEFTEGTFSSSPSTPSFLLIASLWTAETPSSVST
jgi:hypothetical protein